jgi:hypothetical protein
MQIKRADDKQAQLVTLTALLARPDLDARAREEVGQELRTVQAGVTGEQEAAYEIEFRYADDPNVATVHDLRVECGGRSAQIDHLIINRLLQIWVCESKHFAEGVAINAQGEWERFVGGQPVGMPSPVEQNRKHIAVLEDVVRTGQVTLPKRPGYAIRPEFRSLILVSNQARIQRPARPVEGLDTVIKCDQLATTIGRQLEGEGVFGLLGKAAVKLISQQALAGFAQQLAALHRPIPPSTWTGRFKLPSLSSPAGHTERAWAGGHRAYMSHARRGKPLTVQCGSLRVRSARALAPVWANRGRMSVRPRFVAPLGGTKEGT